MAKCFIYRVLKEFATLIKLFLHEVEEELEEQSKLAIDEDLTSFLERARSNSTWSTASAEDVLQIFNRQLSINKSFADASTDEGFISQKFTPVRNSQRSSFRSTLEPFKRQMSTVSAPRSSFRSTMENFKRQMSTDSAPESDVCPTPHVPEQPKEDDDVPKSREEGEVT